MSLLVIPYAKDKKNILSTDEWYIPQSKKSEKWVDSTLEIPVDDINYFWLYCIARGFLFKNKKIIDDKLKGIVANLKDKVAKLKEKVGIEEQKLGIEEQKVGIEEQKVAKLEKKADIEKLEAVIKKLKADIKKLKTDIKSLNEVIVELEADIIKLDKNIDENIDEIEVLCLEFDINSMKFNTFKGDVKLSTFKDYKERIQKYIKSTKPNALEVAKKEEDDSEKIKENARKLFIAARDKFEELKKQGKDIAEDTLKQAEIAKNNADEAYKTAAAIYREKNKIRVTLHDSAEFVSKNLTFLKKYKDKLGWFLEGVDIDNLVSTTVQ